MNFKVGIGKSDFEAHSDRIIVTEGSDYGVHGELESKKAYTYMKGQMRLSVLTSKQFLEI